MKKFNKGSIVKLILSAVCMLVISFTTGCNQKDEVTSLWDESNFGDRPAPVIDSIGILNGDWAKLAGVAKLRVYGKNFSTSVVENFVQFNDKKGTTFNSTPTTVDVLVPYLAKDTITVRISVYKAVSYSNQKTISLVDPLTNLLTDKFQNPRALATDVQGNLYAAIVNETGVKLGIKKFDLTTGKYVDFLGASINPVTWSGMKFSSDGSLYVVGGQKRIAVVPPAGGVLNTFVAIPSGDGVNSLSDLDFDVNKNIWTGGKPTDPTKNKIYSVTPAKTLTSFAFNGEIKAVRVYDGNLYVAARRDSSDKIYRFKINSATSLGSEETYFDLTGKVPSTVSVTNIAFQSDGSMLVGLSSNPGIMLVSPTGSYENYYFQVLIPSTGTVKYSGMVWDKGSTLYLIQDKTDNTGVTTTSLVKVNAILKSAPNYGLQ